MKRVLLIMTGIIAILATYSMYLNQQDNVKMLLIALTAVLMRLSERVE